MKTKIFSLAPWLLGSVLLALPVTAQDNGPFNSLFQGLYDAIAVLLFEPADVGVTPHIPPGGFAAEVFEAAPHASGGNSNDQSGPPAGATTAIGDSSEAAPYTMPGG